MSCRRAHARSEKQKTTNGPRFARLTVGHDGTAVSQSSHWTDWTCRSVRGDLSALLHHSFCLLLQLLGDVVSANNNWNRWWLRMGARRRKGGISRVEYFPKRWEEGSLASSQTTDGTTGVRDIRRLKSVGNRKTKHVHVASQNGTRQKDAGTLATRRAWRKLDSSLVTQGPAR